MNSDGRPRSWRVVAVSVTGTAHDRIGQPCQDAHSWTITLRGNLVAAVADGAGSVAFSEAGATIAAGIAVETISSREATFGLPKDDAGWRLFLSGALEAVRAAIEVEAAECEAKPSDFAATLILVVATPELIAVAQVGDGVAVASDLEGNITGLTIPQKGEYINETTFLTSDNALEVMQVTVWRGGATHIGLLSDGLEMLSLKMPGGTPYPPFFSPLFNFVANAADEREAKAELTAFLRSPRVTDRTDDDLTLLLATLIG